MYILSQDKTRIYNMSGHIEGIGYEESKDYKQRKSENIRHGSSATAEGGADMGEVKEPYEGGTGSLLEVVDMMCGVTEKLADIVRKQAVLIEQERIAGAVFPADLSEERKQAEDDLDRIEMKLRRI